MKPLQLFTLTLITVLIGFCVTGAQNRTTYSITDVGAFNIFAESRATGINAAGRVTAYDSLSALGHGFLFQNGRRTNLATLSNVFPYGCLTTPYSINDKGDLTGSATDSCGATVAFLWKQGWMDEIPSLSAGNGINIHDQIAGVMPTSGGEHAALWQGGQTIDLGTLGGATSVARAINNNGQVVGDSDTPTGQKQAFLWQDGQMIELNVFNSSSTSAWSINNHGQIVGSFAKTKCVGHAFLWQAGRAIDITPQIPTDGTCGLFGLGGATPRGINDRGQVVGDYGTQNRSGAFLWQNGRFTDLNDLLPAGSGWFVQVARAINRAGQIVGEGLHNGAARAFLMTPPKSADEDENKEGQP